MEGWATEAEAKGWLPVDVKQQYAHDLLGVPVGFCLDSETEPIESFVVFLVMSESHGTGGERWVALPFPTLFFLK